MCRIMEELRDESRKQGAYQIAINLLRMGIGTEEDVAKATGLTLDEVKALAAMVNAKA